MAGRGPLPGAGAKPPDQRRRRNAEPPGTELPAAGYEGDYPPLPASWRMDCTEWVRDPVTREKIRGPVKVKRMRYLPATRRWYDAFARSPMAVLFIETDWIRLQEIAQLKDRYYRGDHTLASELRQQEGLLGATVKDRKAMSLKIADAPEQPAQQPAAASEVRQLRAV